MNTVSTAAAFFRACAGRQVRKTVTGVPTLDTWDAVKADIQRQVEAQGCTDFREEADGTLRFGAQFVMRPVIRAAEVGTLQIRSTDYGFFSENRSRPVWGDKKGSQVEDGKLVKRYPNGRVVTFEILEPEVK